MGGVQNIRVVILAKISADKQDMLGKLAGRDANISNLTFTPRGSVSEAAVMHKMKSPLPLIRVFWNRRQ
jgi:hypothetical protein